MYFLEENRDKEEISDDELQFVILYGKKVARTEARKFYQLAIRSKKLLQAK